MGDPVVYFEIVGGDGPAQQRFYRDLFGWNVKPVESTGDTYARVDGAGLDGGVGAFPGAPNYVTVYVRASDPAAALRRAEELVRDALDDLPDILRAALDRNVAVIISDQGRRHRAYGMYEGDGAHRDNFPDRIVIFRDTLLRDFGHDPDELRAQVLRTVRHELAHHLGADELGVRELGL